MNINIDDRAGHAVTKILHNATLLIGLHSDWIKNCNSESGQNILSELSQFTDPIADALDELGIIRAVETSEGNLSYLKTRSNRGVRDRIAPTVETIITLRA